MGNQEVIRTDDPWSEGYSAGYKDAQEDAAKQIAKHEKDALLLLATLTLITKYVNGAGHAVLKSLRGR